MSEEAMADYMANLRQKIREKEAAARNTILEELPFVETPSGEYTVQIRTKLPEFPSQREEEIVAPAGTPFDGLPFKMTAEHLSRLTWGKDDGYESLRAIYALALEQAQGGKGKERHANGLPFDQQPICQGGRRFGPGCLIYQAWKKAHEVPVLLKMDNGKERAVRELLGVINYAAAAIIVLQEGKDAVE